MAWHGDSPGGAGPGRNAGWWRGARAGLVILALAGVTAGCAQMKAGLSQLVPSVDSESPDEAMADSKAAGPDSADATQESRSETGLDHTASAGAADAAAAPSTGPGAPKDKPGMTPGSESVGSESVESESVDTAETSPELTERYCYRTLAKVDCYRHPQTERVRTRVGYFHETAPGSANGKDGVDEAPE